MVKHLSRNRWNTLYTNYNHMSTHFIKNNYNFFLLAANRMRIRTLIHTQRCNPANIVNFFAMQGDADPLNICFAIF
jgi:hypothetical protein